MDYEKKRLQPGRESSAGVICMLAAIVQIPWAGFVILMALGNRWHIEWVPGSPPENSPVYLLAAFLPAIVGIPVGVYSIRAFGYGKQNLAATVGMGVFVSYFVILAVASKHP